MSTVEQVTKCPGCGSVNTTTKHLQEEWMSLLRASFNKMFGRNAALCGNEIREILKARNVTTIPNIFGDIEISELSTCISKARG